MLIQPPRRDYRTWIIDSRRWAHFRPRPGDIVIATYPKCGTTWMQRIVDLLVFQTSEPRPVMEISPWLDKRFPAPIDAVIARLESQSHRRFVKAHLPFDGLPIHDEVRYIHVARDGRDAALSFHNHLTGFTPQMLAALDAAGLEDETIRRPYPRGSADPGEYFHRWLAEGAVEGHDDGSPSMSFFAFEKSWWEERRRDNVLLVHYADLKTDLPAEMRRIASFLGISVSPGIWPGLIEAAGFDRMRRDGAQLMGSVANLFAGGSTRFFHQGTNGRWRGVLRNEDLATYDAKLRTHLSAACITWLEHGWGAGSPPADRAG